MNTWLQMLIRLGHDADVAAEIIIHILDSLGQSDIYTV